eukprot:3594338-Rhodomonas_salina.1
MHSVAGRACYGGTWGCCAVRSTRPEITRKDPKSTESTRTDLACAGAVAGTGGGAQHRRGGWYAPLTAYARATPCPRISTVLTRRMVLCAYARAMHCPVPRERGTCGTATSIGIDRSSGTNTAEAAV